MVVWICLLLCVEQEPMCPYEPLLVGALLGVWPYNTLTILVSPNKLSALWRMSSIKEGRILNGILNPICRVYYVVASSCIFDDPIIICGTPIWCNVHSLYPKRSWLKSLPCLNCSYTPCLLVDFQVILMLVGFVAI